MIAALLQGTLWGVPESRTSKNGKPFAMACLKVKDSDDALFVRVFVFSETAQAEFMRLADRDALCVQGRLKCEIFEYSGEYRLNLTLTADAVLPLRQERKPKSEPAKTSPPKPPPDARSRQERCTGRWSGPDDGPSDDLPF